MGILDITSRIVNILVGLAALAEKSKPYIKRHKEQTEKDPSASLAAMDYLERPSYEEHNVYRALNVLAKECDFIQSEAFKNSNFLTARNDGILYYDCTNYYSELEQEDGVKTYGKRKEHRPNPIVQMGMFTDRDGIPLAFSIFPGNQNEQQSLKPLEKTILQKFGHSKFIYCCDTELGPEGNREFNHMGGKVVHRDTIH